MSQDKNLVIRQRIRDKLRRSKLHAIFAQHLGKSTFVHLSVKAQHELVGNILAAIFKLKQLSLGNGFLELHLHLVRLDGNITRRRPVLLPRRGSVRGAYRLEQTYADKRFRALQRPRKPTKPVFTGLPNFTITLLALDRSTQVSIHHSRRNLKFVAQHFQREKRTRKGRAKRPAEAFAHVAFMAEQDEAACERSAWFILYVRIRFHIRIACSGMPSKR